MAPKRRLLRNTSPSVSASSDDDASAFQVVERPTNTKSPLAMAPLDPGSDDVRGAGDEIYSSGEIAQNGELIRRRPPPKKMVVAKLPVKNEASPETSPMKRKANKSPSRKKTRKAAAPGSSPRVMSNVAAAQLSRLPLPENPAAAAASGATMSPPPKKAVASEATKSPTPKKAAARTGQADETMNVTPSPEAEAPAREEILPQVQGGEYDAEKHFKEKSQRYWYLWHMVLTLEAEHFLSFKGAFLKIDDTKARILNTKIKKLYVKQMKQHLWWKVTEKDVTKVLVDLSK